MELLLARNKIYKVEFINVLKSVCDMNVSRLSELYDELLGSRKATITFNTRDMKILNEIVIQIMEMEVSIGSCSFHEEN